MPDTPAILLLIFNRPELTRKCLESIRTAQPNRLFIAADGPRPAKSDDQLRCQQAREVAIQIDWDCQVETLFREHNLGCQLAVSQAITWFFEHVDEGIILEDDCIAAPAFYQFCQVMLDRYRDQPQIGTVTGDNFQNGIRRGDGDYYYSKYSHCWGWATWKRAWSLYDQHMSPEPFKSDIEIIRQFDCTRQETRYWQNIFRDTRQGKYDSWAYRMLYTCWKHRLLTVTPQVNLVQNIGFGEDATHTKGNSISTNAYNYSACYNELNMMPLQNADADRHTYSNIYEYSVKKYIFELIDRRFNNLM